MEKILIYTDRTREQAFLKSVADTRDKCNSLIEVFESFQSWQKITTHKEWINLVSDPQGYYDETLLQNVEIKATGGKQPDPAILARLFDINRESYLNIVRGESVTDPDCIPCQKLKIRKGTHAITLSEYQSYHDYLIFDSRSFILNDAAVQTHLEGFKTYASTPQQIAVYQHWQGICEILNKHAQIGYIGLSVLEQAGKLFGLRYVGGEGKLYLNEENLLAEILKSK